MLQSAFNTACIAVIFLSLAAMVAMKVIEGFTLALF